MVRRQRQCEVNRGSDARIAQRLLSREALQQPTRGWREALLARGWELPALSATLMWSQDRDHAHGCLDQHACCRHGGAAATKPPGSPATALAASRCWRPDHRPWPKSIHWAPGPMSQSLLSIPPGAADQQISMPNATPVVCSSTLLMHPPPPPYTHTQTHAPHRPNIQAEHATTPSLPGTVTTGGPAPWPQTLAPARTGSEPFHPHAA